MSTEFHDAWRVSIWRFALMNCREKQQFGILAFRCHRKMGHLSELAHGVPREASVMMHSQSRALVRKQP